MAEGSGEEPLLRGVGRRATSSDGGIHEFSEEKLPPMSYGAIWRRVQRYFHCSVRDIPVLTWGPAYSLQKLVSDLLAGVSILFLLVPQSLAYAKLAGLPPIYGVYSSTIPLILYALLGSSTQLAVGPVGPTSILLNQLTTAMHPGSEEERVRVALALGMVCGVVLVVAGMLRLGFVANLLSLPVQAGFMTAAGFIIAASQLRDLFGMQTPALDSVNFFVRIVETLGALPSLHWPTTAIGVSSLLLLASFKHWHKLGLWPCSHNQSPPPRWVPIQLLVVVVCILISWLAHLPSTAGVRVVGDVPLGFPAPLFPIRNGAEFFALLPSASIQAIVGFVGTISLAVAFGKKVGADVSANIELAAQGVASIVGAVFSSIPPAGSFTRTALNAEIGAKTPLAGGITGLLMIVVLLVAASLFHYLPLATLAAMIIASCQSLLAFDRATLAWNTRASDFFEFAATFLLTLLLGVGNGVIASIGMSIVLLVLRALRPRVLQLGILPGTQHYVALERYPAAQILPSVFVLRIDGELNFGNIRSVTARLARLRRAIQNPQPTSTTTTSTTTTSPTSPTTSSTTPHLHAQLSSTFSYLAEGDEQGEEESSTDEEPEPFHTPHTPLSPTHPPLSPHLAASSSSSSDLARPRQRWEPPDKAFPRPPSHSTWWQDPTQVRVVVVDCSRITSLDLSACDSLNEVAAGFQKARVVFKLAGLFGEARDTLLRFLQSAANPATIDTSSITVHAAVLEFLEAPSHDVETEKTAMALGNDPLDGEGGGEGAE